MVIFFGRPAFQSATGQNKKGSVRQRPSPATPFCKSKMPPFLIKEIHVQPSMLDVNGHVNNIVYVQWMQDIAIEHADSAGFGNELNGTASCNWVAKCHHIEYRQSAFANDTVLAATWIAKTRKVGCQRKYTFHRKSEAALPLLLAHAQTDWVLVDSENGRPQKIPAEALNRIKALGDTPDIPFN